MDSAPRQARLMAVAKLNLSLEVLHRRPDGFHELRTIFQTVSLADRIDLTYTPGRRNTLRLESDVEIENNLVIRAAEALFPHLRTKGDVRIRLVKRIPMGGGLGGGSTDAAAILLALPALSGSYIPIERLLDIAASFGSDIPYFLIGGTALGLGRGTDLYPIKDARAGPALIVVPEVQVSTAAAYRALGRGPLTPNHLLPKINISQSVALAIGGELSAEGWGEYTRNDFEPVVFRDHPQLRSIRQKLEKAGGLPARMTGSGAALYAVFRSISERRRAQLMLEREKVIPVSFISQARYRSLWWRQLGDHIQGNIWPPQSRYSR